MAEREVVVVTGASGGVGRAVASAVRQAQRGGQVDRAGARRTRSPPPKTSRTSAGSAYAHQADVAGVPDEVSAAATAIEARLAPIDMWINNAMTTGVRRFLDDIDPHEYERATRVTIPKEPCGEPRSQLARMLPRDRGTIVQVGSALASPGGSRLQAPYCGAKHAMKGMFESLRCELRHRGSAVNVTMVQLPGMNTPQFDHCLSKMPRHPMPVPPIYEPEVAARAIYWAAHHRRRELYVGLPTVYTIIGNKLAPWLAERYLAKTAVDGQQTGERFDGAAAANLFEPVDDDHDEGSRGSFDDKSHTRSEQAWLSRHRLGSELAAAAVTGVAAALLTRRRA